MADHDGSSRAAPGVASHRSRIVEHRWVNARYRHLRLKSSENLEVVTQPGQFYQLKCPLTPDQKPFLLRPMSAYSAGPESGRIEFLYKVAGTGTAALSQLQIGEYLDIVGPLGNTFTFDPAYKKVVFVARGVGLATMAPLVAKAAKLGVAVIAVMSARAPADLMKDEFLRGADADVRCVYDSDGSSRMEAVDVLLREIFETEKPDAVYTCGSHRILMLLQEILRDYPKMLSEVAMEQRMACGMGVCLSCVRLFNTKEGKQFKRVCREGPVFPIREVVGEVEFG
jgi:dihydroorotate dehydrogenase electron transfer subunit